MHSLARKFPRYATTRKTRQGASLDHLVGEREQLLGNLQDLLRGATQISANALAC